MTIEEAFREGFQEAAGASYCTTEEQDADENQSWLNSKSRASRGGILPGAIPETTLSALDLTVKQAHELMMSRGKTVLVPVVVVGIQSDYITRRWFAEARYLLREGEPMLLPLKPEAPPAPVALR